MEPNFRPMWNHSRAGTKPLFSGPVQIPLSHDRPASLPQGRGDGASSDKTGMCLISRRMAQPRSGTSGTGCCSNSEKAYGLGTWRTGNGTCTTETDPRRRKRPTHLPAPTSLNTPDGWIYREVVVGVGDQQRGRLISSGHQASQWPVVRSPSPCRRVGSRRPQPRRSVWYHQSTTGRHLAPASTSSSLNLVPLISPRILKERLTSLSCVPRPNPRPPRCVQFYF